MARTRTSKQRLTEKLLSKSQKCWICQYRIHEGEGTNYLLRPSLDHVVPKSQGGTDGKYNLRLSHRVCNSLRSSEDWTEELMKKCRERVRELEGTVVKMVEMGPKGAGE